MAQGVQKKTEYAGLQFLGVSAVKKLLGFEIREAPGEHARGKFRVLLSEEAPVVCERNVPVQLREEGNRAEALFCGYPQRTETMTEHGWRIAEIEAVSGTVLLDMENEAAYSRTGGRPTSELRVRSRRKRGTAPAFSPGTTGRRAEHSSSTGRQTGNSSREWRPGWDCPWCRTRGIITRGFTWGCRRGRKRSSGRFSPAGSALTGVIMRSAGDVPLIERISSAMMWSRGQGCR